MGLTLFRHALGSNSCTRRPSLISLLVMEYARREEKRGREERERGREGVSDSEK